MPSTSTSARIAVVGGGIAGLAAARVLADAGARVTVLDKGRGPGGRASTRRQGAHRFDHGAQYFTARDPRFRAAVAAWRDAGIAAEWTGTIAEVNRAGDVATKPPGEPRWVGVPGMSAAAGHLAAGLRGRADVRFAARVTALARAGDGWRVRGEHDPRAAAPGALGASIDATFDERCDALLVCVPAPQALALLDGLTPLADEVRREPMEPCWAAMYAFDEALPIAPDGLFVNVPGQPVAWASRDGSKPGRPPGERWVVHAAPAWTRAHLDDAPDQVHRALLDALGAAVGRALPAPAFADAHRWRHARGALAREAPSPGALVDPARRLAIAGDWCRGGRVEGAWLSGVAAAEALLDGEVASPGARE